MYVLGRHFLGKLAMSGNRCFWFPRVGSRKRLFIASLNTLESIPLVTGVFRGRRTPMQARLHQNRSFLPPVLVSGITGRPQVLWETTGVLGDNECISRPLDFTVSDVGHMRPDRVWFFEERRDRDLCNFSTEISHRGNVRVAIETHRNRAKSS